MTKEDIHTLQIAIKELGFEVKEMKKKLNIIGDLAHENKRMVMRDVRF